jgi:hypothetical protein
MAMPSQLGPIAIDCDAPSYAIVHACERLGMANPEDVRWCRMSHFLNAAKGWRGLFNRETWKLLWETKAAPVRPCFCGRPLPKLMGYTFTMSAGKELSYCLGQCGKCHTVFWDEATVKQEA